MLEDIRDDLLSVVGTTDVEPMKKVIEQAVLHLTREEGMVFNETNTLIKANNGGYLLVDRNADMLILAMYPDNESFTYITHNQEGGWKVADAAILSISALILLSFCESEIAQSYYRQIKYPKI